MNELRDLYRNICSMEERIVWMDTSKYSENVRLALDNLCSSLGVAKIDLKGEV